MPTINQKRAELLGKEFAKEHGRSMDDPIVVDLIRGLKMAFGSATARNRRKAEQAERQPGLFPRSAKTLVEIQTASDYNRKA